MLDYFKFERQNYTFLFIFVTINIVFAYKSPKLEPVSKGPQHYDYSNESTSKLTYCDIFSCSIIICLYLPFHKMTESNSMTSQQMAGSLIKNVITIMINYSQSSQCYKLIVVSIMCLDIIYSFYELHLDCCNAISLLRIAIICCEISTLTMIPFLKTRKPSIARLYILILGLSNMVINQVI